MILFGEDHLMEKDMNNKKEQLHDPYHTVYCEICLKEYASEIQGGLYKDTRKLWFCCKSCKNIIVNERKSVEDIRRNYGIPEEGV